MVTEDTNKRKKFYYKELASSFFIFLGKMSNNVYNLSTRICDSKIEIKRLGLLYNMDSK